MDLAQLGEAAAAGDIDTVIVAQTDMQGRLMGKRFHATHFLEAAHRETHGCNYVLATDMEMLTVDGYRSTSWAAGYGDYVMRPDLSTLRRIPWLEGTALVLCDVYDHHGEAEIAHGPRAALKRQIERLARRGLAPMMASELEFLLFEESYEAARAKNWRGLTPVSGYNEDYHVFQTTKEEGVMRAIRNGLVGAGVPVENTKGEAEAGQAELNIRYSSALDMADWHTIAKNAVKEIAWAQGRSASFVAKYADDVAGNAAHIHQSLTDRAGEPAFFDPSAPLGMSAAMRGYLAGLLAHADAITLFLAPYSNSYKRFVPGTFAPTRVLWSPDNRTAGFRLCGADGPAVRIECRIGGADLNPYLAAAALIAAGLDGIERGLELEPAFRGDAYAAQAERAIPGDLRAAIRATERSTMLREAFGEAVIEHYLRAARHEQAETDRRVNDWDLRRLFERG